MDALKKVDTDEKVQSEDTNELIDCGRASERTQGVPIGFFSEDVFPPFNRRLV